ncbi:MAG TPA: hypothetical protein VJC07_05290 [Candidatus Nanoarchaeia archaeon]|nr:hypothetical protein [Candidatus Nanoarchaeia archaeon]
MNKKGQVYILAAVIIAFLIYVLFAETNIVKETIIEDDFEEISSNYEIESAKFVNSLIGQDTEKVVNSFASFSSIFSSYAKTKNPEFSLIYLFSYNDGLYVGNFLDEEVSINSIQQTLDGCFEEIDTSIIIAGLDVAIGNVNTGDVDVSRCVAQFSNSDNEIEVKVKDVRYRFELEQNRPEIVIVTREKKGEQRKVYTKGEFIPPAPRNELPEQASDNAEEATQGSDDE